MGQVDAVHDAEDERQSGREQEEHEAELQAVEGLFEEELGHGLAVTVIPGESGNDGPGITSSCTEPRRHPHGW